MCPRASPAGRQDAEWVQSYHPCHATVVSPPPLQSGQGCPLVGRPQCVQHATRCTVPRSCRRSAPISLRSRLGSTVVTVTRAPCSPAPAVSLLRLSPAQEAFSKETPRSSPCRTRHPPGRQGTTTSSGDQHTPAVSTCAPFFFDDGLSVGSATAVQLLPLSCHGTLREDRPGGQPRQN